MFRTCTGYSGGEISSETTNIPGQIASLAIVPEQGVFIQEFLTMLAEHGISMPLMAVDEENPNNIVTGVEK